MPDLIVDVDTNGAYILEVVHGPCQPTPTSSSHHYATCIPRSQLSRNASEAESPVGRIEDKDILMVVAMWYGGLTARR